MSDREERKSHPWTARQLCIFIARGSRSRSSQVEVPSQAGPPAKPACEQASEQSIVQMVQSIHQSINQSKQARNASKHAGQQEGALTSKQQAAASSRSKAAARNGPGWRGDGRWAMDDGRWARGPPGGERESKRGPRKSTQPGTQIGPQRGGTCKSWRTMRLFSSPPGDVLACVLASGWEGEGPLDERGTKDQGRGPAKSEGASRLDRRPN